LGATLASVVHSRNPIAVVGGEGGAVVVVDVEVDDVDVLEVDVLEVDVVVDVDVVGGT
jgi:hypothetical protein